MGKEDVPDKPLIAPGQLIRGTSVLLGLFADVLATFAIALALVVINRSWGGASEVLLASLAGPAGGALGLFATAFGGYICAVSAGRDEVRHALVMGLVLVLLGLAAFVAMGGRTPSQAAAVLLSLPAACLGGYLRSQQRSLRVAGRPDVEDAPSAQPLVELALPRCPFCLASVRRDERLVVCRGCLAQHHEACWAEATRCAACRGTVVLAVKTPLPIRRMSVIAGSVLVSAVAGYIALRPLIRPWFVVASPTPPPSNPPAEPVATISTSTVQVRRAPRLDAFDVPWQVDEGAVDDGGTLPPFEWPTVPEAAPVGTFVRFGGDPRADTWRPVGEAAWAPIERPLKPEKYLEGDSRRLVVLTGRTSPDDGDRDLVVHDATRAAPLRFTLRLFDEYCLSGNRLLYIDAPSLHFLDLDAGKHMPSVHLGWPVRLAACAAEPRRVYGLVNGNLVLIDAERGRVVATARPLERSHASELGNRLFTDARGRWVYVVGAGVRVCDPTHDFQLLLSLPSSPGSSQQLLWPDPAGRFVFSATSIHTAGGMKLVSSPGGRLLGELSDGMLLTVTAGSGFLQRRDPWTADPVGDPLVQLGKLQTTALTLLRGTDRLVRLNPDTRRLEVADVPPLRRAPAGRALRLTRFPQGVAWLGEEWSYTPVADGLRGSRLSVSGPSGLTWDGVTARWRPGPSQVGQHEVTVSSGGSGEGTCVTVEPLWVRPRTMLFPDKALTGRKVLRLMGGLIAWIDRASGALRVLEQAPWRIREVRVGGRDVTELGDSLWVVTKEGSLAQLGLVDLQTTNEVVVPGVRIELVDALPDGRLGWVGHDDGEQLVVGRYRPGETTCQLALPVPQEGDFVKGWQCLDTDDFVISFARGLGATNSVAWSWGENALERGEYNAALPDMLPDGTTFLVDRVLRPDGSTLRVHEVVAGWRGGRGDRPQPSQDGGFYVAMERDDALTGGQDGAEGQDGSRNACAVRICFYRLPDAALLGSMSVGVAHYGDRVLLLDQANLLVILRESTNTDYDPIRNPDLFFAVPYDPDMVERHADEAPQGR